MNLKVLKSYERKYINQKVFLPADKYLFSMLGRAWEKVPGGRLRITVEHDGAFVRRVQLSGDFPIFPSESKTEIESALVGISIKTDEKNIARKIENFLRRKKLFCLV
jgi:hypothetical protein